jgi:hypothetical protein
MIVPKEHIGMIGNHEGEARFLLMGKLSDLLSLLYRILLALLQ